MKIPSLDRLYWQIKRIAGGNDSLSRLFLKACINLDVRRDTLLKLMPDLVPPGSVIYDVGAHIGLYSILLAKKVRDSLVYAFEPNPESYRDLVRNIRLTRLEDRIIPLNFALGAVKSKLDFYVSSSSARSSFYELIARYDNNRILKTLSVECFTIDQIVQERLCKSADVMKIDVEGFEYEVLKGARNTIAVKSPQIFVEIHGDANGVPNTDRVKEFLEPFGYEFKELGYPLWCYRKPFLGGGYHKQKVS